MNQLWVLKNNFHPTFQSNYVDCKDDPSLHDILSLDFHKINLLYNYSNRLYHPYIHILGLIEANQDNTRWY